MDKKECWTEINRAFEDKFDHLGKVFAEEFLKAIASWNIQQYSEPEFRVRRHPLLFWQSGWLKSSLLNKAYQILGQDLCTIMSDVSLAALRGTVEHGRFISPFTLKTPFSICTEFGQVIGGMTNTEIVQKLLAVLEEGSVSVSLGKISELTPEQINHIQDDYNIYFVDSNTFTYKTNWILFAATYNKKFLIDNAFESRFSLVMPSKPLDSALAKKVINSKPFVIEGDATEKLREFVKQQITLDCSVKLPDEVYELDITMRDASTLLSDILCKKWWGVNSSKEEVINEARCLKLRQEEAWKTADDRVLELLETGPKTIDELKAKTGLSMRSIRYSIKNLRAMRYLEPRENKYYYKLV